MDRCEEMKDKIRILHIAQAAGGVDRYMKDVHNKFNARRVSDEHGKLFERI